MTVTFTRRATIEDLVRELVVAFADTEGGPGVRHVCVAPAVRLVGPSHLRCSHSSCVAGRESRVTPPPCSHHALDRMALLDRLQLLVPQGQVVESSGRPQGGRVKGSPAPWSAAPAELIDEIMRGAVELYAEGARVVGRDALQVSVPGSDRSVPVQMAGRDEAGRAALLALPGLVVELDRVGHRLGIRSNGDRLEEGVIEERVRSWHGRAQDLTGHRVPWERVPPAPNPDFHRRVEGATCAARQCGHGSCDRLRFRRRRYVALLCPQCGADSLRLDPTADVVRCIRPSCVRSEAGEWTCSRTAMEEVLANPWSEDE